MDRMLAEQRQEEIMQILREHKFAEVEKLAALLGVSNMTIRRDLLKLSQEGRIRRQHGGASLSDPIRWEKDYAVKQNASRESKKAIARMALELVQNGDSVFLDSGTTTFEIAMLLRERKCVTVLTADIPIANALLGSDVEVVMVGGMVQSRTGSVIGSAAVEFLRRFRVQTSFIAAPAVNHAWDVMTPTVEKAYLKQAAITIAQNTYLVADPCKFYGVSISRVCNLSDLSGLITDRDFTPEELTDLAEKDIQLICRCEDPAAE